MDSYQISICYTICHFSLVFVRLLMYICKFSFLRQLVLVYVVLRQAYQPTLDF
jgi:hypothetical protein